MCEFSADRRTPVHDLSRRIPGERRGTEFAKTLFRDPPVVHFLVYEFERRTGKFFGTNGRTNRRDRRSTATSLKGLRASNIDIFFEILCHDQAAKLPLRWARPLDKRVNEGNGQSTQEGLLWRFRYYFGFLWRDCALLYIIVRAASPL